MSSFKLPDTAAPPPDSFGEAGNTAATTIDTKQAAILSIEGLAMQYRILPVTLMRENC